MQPAEDVIKALLTGDEAAFGELVDAWTPAMLAVARRYVATAATAEDVVQDTWIAVLRGLPQFRGEASLRTWVFRILANVARRRGSQEARVTPWSLTVDDDAVTFGPERFRTSGDPWPGHWCAGAEPRPWGPEELLLSDELQNVVSDALQELPERQRTVVQLRDIDGFASEEVCELLEITPANQRVLLHRGRACVREALDSYLGSGVGS